MASIKISMWKMKVLTVPMTEVDFVSAYSRCSEFRNPGIVARHVSSTLPLLPLCISLTSKVSCAVKRSLSLWWNNLSWLSSTCENKSHDLQGVYKLYHWLQTFFTHTVFTLHVTYIIFFSLFTFLARFKVWSLCDHSHSRTLLNIY